MKIPLERRKKFKRMDEYLAELQVREHGKNKRMLSIVCGQPKPRFGE